MKMRNVCLSPGLVAPGMVLANAVNGHDGQPLLAAGAELDADMLERLIRRGIETVWVATPDERDADTIALELRNAEARIATIFRGSGNPAREALRQAIQEYRRESLK